MKEGHTYLVNLGALTLIKIRITKIDKDKTTVEYINTSPVSTEVFDTHILKKLIVGL